MSSPQLSLIGLSITTSPATSKSSSSCSSDAGSSSADSDPPAAYHVNLANLVPTLQLPPPLRGMQRLRATAQRQWVGHLDVIGILAKVVMRPRPQIHLGPIDHTASCVIVDLDLPDRPLVWASDSFCTMSGYALEDIIGRNPRFMQAPGGHVLTPSQRGSPPRSSPTSDHSKQTFRPSASTNSSSSSTETIQTSSSQQTDPKPELDPYIPPPSSHVPAGSPRAHTDQGTVQRIKAHLDANLEIQTTVLNYKRDGTPFWNWLSVVPVREAGEGSRFRYHVGIMADLVQQPKAIMRTMQAGFYIRTQA